MDEQKRIELVEKLQPYINDQDCYEPTPLVPLELFFDGNDDEGSIGANLMNHPGVSVFFETLMGLREHLDVSGVWIIAKQHDWKPGWPHSDEVLIRTRLSETDVSKILSLLRPDEVGEAMQYR